MSWKGSGLSSWVATGAIRMYPKQKFGTFEDHSSRTEGKIEIGAVL